MIYWQKYTFIFDNSLNEKFINFNDEIKLTGNAGDLVFFNSEGIHSASPISNQGRREMLFFMCYNNSIRLYFSS